jgi:tetratricopeptide (TPR) repeat protein
MKDVLGNLYTHRETRPSLADEIAAEQQEPSIFGGDLLKQLKGMRKRRAMMRRIMVVVALVYAVGLAAFIALILMRNSAERTGRRMVAGATVTNRPAALPGAAVYDSKAMRLAIQQWKDAGEKLHDARLWIQKGRRDTAGALLQEILAANPNHSEALFESAQLSVQQDANDRARDLLQRLLTVDPQRKAAIQMLATVYSRAEQHEQALSLANWIMETDPDCTEAHRIAGVAAFQAKRFDLALAHFRKWAVAEPENMSAQKQYADVLLALKEYAKALVIYEGILKKKPDEADAYRQMAVCFAQQAMVEQAVSTLIQAIYNVGAAKVAPWFRDPGFEGVRHQKLFSLLERQVTLPHLSAKAGKSSGPSVQMNPDFELQRIQQIQSMLKMRH